MAKPITPNLHYLLTGHKHSGRLGRASGKLYAKIRSKNFVKISKRKITLGANLRGKEAGKAKIFQTSHPSHLFGHLTGNTTPGRPFMGIDRATRTKGNRDVNKAFRQAYKRKVGKGSRVRRTTCTISI